MIRLTTSMGVIDIELDPAKAPVTSANFEQYVKDGFYNGTLFHRVIKGFMIQGGGYTAGMKEKQTRDPIVNEASNGLANNRYTIAMARTSDPDSATAQFFINVADNDFLNYSAGNAGYAVFGRVVKGSDVVDAIAAARTGRRGWFDDVPLEDVVIEKAEIL
ncbi:peptidyl-prolyl cis-trans isomerase [Mesosutterella sp. OilRF-GAM-744-9]|uniref:Peptidyl-prolyl cis-trans isomerase n=1 Tax=Mesosutterella porci TaxID=2915351 RepID=A0ABS9MPJ0_9BURK|nr:peptidylprolyl isomerase [Mesosutterella sp. oilRF-744-WT-GAM-9]MCG5030452.1 peptidyl-prolyl cis-trans isomerase [Mesosutterella sp. oilRF-744-WT-GAM-9]